MELTSYGSGDLCMVSSTGGRMPLWEEVFFQYEVHDSLQVGTVEDGDIVLCLGESHSFSKSSIYVKVLAAGMVGWLAGYILDKI